MMQQTYPQVHHDYCYELNKDFNFAAAHFVPDDRAGKCQYVHGHTYFVNLTIAGDELDETGFLVDFKALKELVHAKYDHTLMNDHLDDFSSTDPNQYPTTEVVARTIWRTVQAFLDTKSNAPTCVQVYVRETPTSYVVYRPKKAGGA
jgi:6-pyruvoyltetrahydropterin/6-carboxytetrahydropterin synthase